LREGKRTGLSVFNSEDTERRFPAASVLNPVSAAMPKRSSMFRSASLAGPNRSAAWGLTYAGVALVALALGLTPGVVESRSAASGATLEGAAGAGATRTFQGTLEAKIRELSAPATVKPKSFQPIVITEDEANAYLRAQGPSFLPPAVSDPEIQIRADHVAAVAMVDFDKLQKVGAQTNDIGEQVLGTLFKGRQKVSASGKLQTSDGKGQLTIENLSIGTTSIPDWLTAALLQNYVERTYKLDLSKPFTLPDHVTRIDLAQGRATFVRSPAKLPALAVPASKP
jgi:hypothetical protein